MSSGLTSGYQNSSRKTNPTQSKVENMCLERQESPRLTTTLYSMTSYTANIRCTANSHFFSELPLPVMLSHRFCIRVPCLACFALKSGGCSRNDSSCFVFASWMWPTMLFKLLVSLVVFSVEPWDTAHGVSCLSG